MIEAFLISPRNRGRLGRRWVWIAALCSAVAYPVGATANLPRPRHVTPETQAAIEKALTYLTRNQSRDGSWRSGGRMGQYPTAMTALASLALLASGSTTTQGPYAKHIDRATNYLLGCATSTGLITRMEEESRSMYGHGFTMLFLGQLYGMEEDVARGQRIRRVLRAAVELTARSQSGLGGWIYTPDRSGDEGSVTITQVQGLRSCRNAGIEVPKKVIDQALRYLDKSMQPDGGIAYRVGQRGSRPPITAAAVACWFNAGLYDHPNAVKALNFCRRRIGSQLNVGGHSFYTHLYMSQVMYLAGQEEWDRYFPPIRDALLASQGLDGTWQGDYVGKVYGTAIGLLILQLPNNMLPIMQR